MENSDQIIRNALIVNAIYREEKIPSFQNNPFIRALPPSLDDDGLNELLYDLPNFKAQQREWDTYDRLHLVGSLGNFMRPLVRQVYAARALDSMVRNGYIGRIPYTKEHIEILQKLYEAQQLGEPFYKTEGISREPIPPTHLSNSLIGLSGMGKTAVVRRFFAHYPKVIFHPHYNVYQIPYLHIEAPIGMSLEGMCHSIIRAIDQFIPDANYFQIYGKPRTSVTALMNNCARLMHIHFVGILVLDEVQNLTYGTGGQQLMSGLVATCNQLSVPVLFVGTNNAKEILGMDFRQARRSSGAGFPHWEKLECLNQPSNLAAWKEWDDFICRNGADCNLFNDPNNWQEWEDFISTLWEYQWVQKPIAFSEAWSHLMYFYSQGIIDIAIKLFACAQWRAILDLSEELTPQVVRAVARNELALLYPMIDALRRNDQKALKNWLDIMPIGLDQLKDKALFQYMGMQSRKASPSPETPEFLQALVTSIKGMHIADNVALNLAQAIVSEGKAKTILEATKEAIKRMTPPKRQQRKGTTKSNSQYAQDDLRNAVALAKVGNTTFLKQLENMDYVADFDHLLDLD